MKNKKKSSLHNIFLNFNRICYLAKNGIISENKIKEEMGEIMHSIWNNYSTREICEMIVDPEKITYYRKFVKENLQI